MGVPRFFAFDARITRVRVITGLVITTVPAWITLLLLRSGEASGIIAAGAIGGATVTKLVSESVRRRHDADTELLAIIYAPDVVDDEAVGASREWIAATAASRIADSLLERVEAGHEAPG